MNELLSIIIPVYNVEKYLDRCIKSVLNQTYNNLEIILVDDGSTDKSPEICDKYAKNDTRIKVIHKKNGGVSEARNCGIEIAKGTYLGFVDSDDFIKENMYEFLMSALKRTNSDIATCGRFICDEKITYRKYVSKKEVVLDAKNALQELLNGGIINEASYDKIYKKELFDNIRFPVGETNEDIVTIPFVIEKANKVVCTGVPLYYYCMNPTSITHSEYNGTKHVIIEHINYISSYMKNLYPELADSVKEFECRYAVGVLGCFEKDSKQKKKYLDDYSYYKEIAYRNWFLYLKSKYRTIYEKIIFICIVVGLFNFARNVKRFLIKGIKTCS